MTSTSYDAIVIGAGIAGASAAYFLASRGRRVVIVEKEPQPGMHSTGRSAAMLIINYGEPQTVALAKVAEPFLRSPPPGFCDHPLLSPRGCLLLAELGEERDLENAAAAAIANGVPGEVLRPDGVAKIVSRIRQDAIAGGLLEAGAAAIDVDALHRGFLRGVRQLGGDLVLGIEAVDFRRRDGVWRLQIPGGELTAPLVINAAGGWADVVGRRMGASPLNLIPRQRTAGLVSPPVGVDISGWPLVLHVNETYYFKPDAGKLLISPADETEVSPGDVQPDDFDIAVAVDRIERVAELEIARVTHRWAGMRTFAADRRFVVGFDSSVEGLFWVAGQGGAGIMTSPSAGLLTAELSEGVSFSEAFAAAGLNPADLSPSRFA